MSEFSKINQVKLTNTISAFAWISNTKFIYSVWLDQNLFIYDKDAQNKKFEVINSSTYYTALFVYNNVCYCGNGQDLTIDILDLKEEKIKKDGFGLGEICETIISDISVFENTMHILCKSKKKNLPQINQFGQKISDIRDRITL